MNKENEELLAQIRDFELAAIETLSDLVTEIRLPKYADLVNFDQIEKAERALYLLDPENPAIIGSENIKKQKTIENLLENDDPQNNFFSILERAKIEYHAESKPETFFSFPNANQLNLSCRFFGKKVLFTGFYLEEKAQIAIITELLNLTIASCVSSKLDFLICGSNAGPAKVRKARELNVPIIQAANFICEITKETPRSEIETFEF